MLQVVEYLDVDVVGRIVECHQFAQAVVVVILVGEFEDGLARLFTQPHDGTADEVVVPLAGGDLPRITDARQV